eukprot:TRINITY_DN12223_c0_g1_i1.p1 TRINITY_DN12223_c0_g1~~TRINITY_DN12223_c0_g1_i1.p1  ORF type:complete len:378 (+),score=41.72 TRINITY_DN12223_c0_g1_i1:106-1239(+)
MGQDGSKQVSSNVKTITPSEVSENKMGLENFGNTCYVNSVVQALYWCVPFRLAVLKYYEENNLAAGCNSLLACVGDLFLQLQSSKKRTGRVAPKKLIQRMRQQSDQVFSSYQQQDAHEFFVYLINDMTDTMNSKSKEKSKTSATESASSHEDTHEEDQPPPTFIQQFFEGKFASEMRCLSCESVTSREEEFLGLSLDINQNVSLLSALRGFSRGEHMDRDNKFYCDQCRSLQEARRSLRMKRAPPILAIHLKRFKYIEEFARHCKLSYRVPFPFTMRLPMEGPQADDLYQLFAVVIHQGVGPNIGHYICMAKSSKNWILLDDDCVTPITERDVAHGYGADCPTDVSTSTGYLLFYSSLPFVESSMPASVPVVDVDPS